MAIKRGTPKKDSFLDDLESDATQPVAEYQKQIAHLKWTIDELQHEIDELRSQKRVEPEDANARLYDMKRELIQAHRRNRQLTNVLQEAKEKLEILKEKVEQLSAPPNNYGVFLGLNDDSTVDIDVSGRKWRVNLDPGIKPQELEVGQQVIVNSGMNVVGIKPAERHGDVVKVKERLSDERAIVSLRTDEERLVRIAALLKDEPMKIGDNVLLNHSSGMLMEKLPKPEVEDLLLEEVPDIGYGDIGGLDTQIEAIRDAIEMPYLYPAEYQEFNLAPPKGVLLYGPPGCGKTLIARAVASGIAARVRKQTGRDDVRSYFINIKGPELLNKYVGETERKIREVFQKARDKSREGFPVIIFFDEMDSLFRSRGMGISSDMESTLVPQFLSEIDGVENLHDVIVIGASNRQDLLDPAVLRPGRLDIKIKIDRPNMDGAKDIFGIYLTPALPFAKSESERFNGDPHAIARHLIEGAVDQMYATTDDNRFIEVTYARGERETLFFKDFVSGAMIKNIVSRAKKTAIKRLIASEGQEKGICLADLKGAIREEYQENEDLPNTTNPDDWAKISGRKGEKIVNIRALINEPGTDRKQDVRVTRGGTFL